MKIQSFAIAHNQEDLLNVLPFYSQLENFTFIFVGLGDCDKLIDVPEVIIARNLPDNIENYPHLLHLTAYYAIVKNNLIHNDTNYLRLYEYDLSFTQQDIKNTGDFIKRFTPDLLVHLTNPVTNNWYDPLYFVEPNDRILSKFNTSVDKLTKQHNLRHFICSLNFVIKKELFIDFFNFLINNCINEYMNTPQAGNLIERMLTLFSLMKNKKWHIYDKGFRNKFFDSHKTSSSEFGRFEYLKK